MAFKFENPIRSRITMCPNCHHKIAIVNEVAVTHVERSLWLIITFSSECNCGCRWPR